MDISGSAKTRFPKLEHWELIPRLGHRQRPLLGLVHFSVFTGTISAPCSTLRRNSSSTSSVCMYFILLQKQFEDYSIEPTKSPREKSIRPQCTNKQQKCSLDFFFVVNSFPSGDSLFASAQEGLGFQCWRLKHVAQLNTSSDELQKERDRMEIDNWCTSGSTAGCAPPPALAPPRR